MFWSTASFVKEGRKSLNLDFELWTLGLENKISPCRSSTHSKCREALCAAVHGISLESQTDWATEQQHSLSYLILQGDKKVSLGLRLLLNLNYSFWFGTNNAIPPMHLIHKMEIIILAKENK